MGREENVELKVAKKGFREAEAEGNREEEARWANVIGDILKRRGEYVEALRWLRRDYELSTKHLPQKQLLPTCQSLGEVYFRLERFREALTYQKKHLQLAKDSEDLIEQQRASTQLGRTYHEIFLKSEDDHYALQNAKKYFKAAMKLARTLKEKQSYNKCSLFLKEFIDAYNNLGMLEKDLDNLEEAKKILLQGLKICDDEEVSENDDGRTRLHHNLGSVYLELREWTRAKEHIERDIRICKNIDHPEGEAKGFINLGELHYQMQNYEDAIHCYHKALNIASSMQDEDALVHVINQNIDTTKEAKKVLEEVKREELKLRKLARTTSDARGTGVERKCLLEQYALLDCLIEKSHSISAWSKLQEFAKRKKKVADELCDIEKLSDSYLAIGESYQKLRNFSKARKWYMKSWNVSRSIRNLEGQALAKINIGNVLDSAGDWAGALESLAIEGNFPSAQLSALENMHYSHMIRFSNVEQARKLQDDIQKLRRVVDNEDELKNFRNEYCSETETEGEEISSRAPDAYHLREENGTVTSRVLPTANVDDFGEDRPLASLVSLKKNQSKAKISILDSHSMRSIRSLIPESPRDLSKSSHSQQHARKRARVIISDDEDESDASGFLRGQATTDPDTSQPSGTKSVGIPSVPLVHLEESASSFKSRSSKHSNGIEMDRYSLSPAEDFYTRKGLTREFKMDQSHISGGFLPRRNGTDFHLPNCEEAHAHTVTFKVEGYFISVDICPCMKSDRMCEEYLKAAVGCLYYFQLPEEKKSKGLLPIIRSLKVFGKGLEMAESVDEIRDHVFDRDQGEGAIEGWVPKRLLKSYIDCCKKQSEEPSMKLLIKLYNLEVSEDEVSVSDCGLQDVSISPFLEALQEHKSLAVLDLSHNLLGNNTVEKLQQIFSVSRQKYGGLTLDLHCNQFGPTALFQICECAVLLSRLEVLNLSENRLTDACGSYLSAILVSCRSLYSLNLEQTCITSRTIQKIADALPDGSPLSQLFIGRNSPVSGTAAVNLLSRLSTLKRFSELSMRGIKLNKPMVDGLYQLARSSNLSVLNLGGSSIGSARAIQLVDALSVGSGELVKLDLSFCGLDTQGLAKICTNSSIVGCVTDLNLGGNSFGREGCGALGQLLADSRCCIRVLNLDRCRLGFSGIVHILESASENESIEELYLAENVDATAGAPSPCEQQQQKQPNDADDRPEDLAGGSMTNEERLSAAIAAAVRLQLVDLSGNGLAEEAAEALYGWWRSSPSRRSSARRHVKGSTIHFSVEGKTCCSLKACCRRDP
ncbi:unnamed protein product [Spirodela intermedia]|uniref:Protein TONSOKU n=1 Tax=Spirodela intermedia TaxID=51605 RepID=A0A7I8L5K7_SPIIN|nr:unnamed protein product [Spirodela intermedia]